MVSEKKKAIAVLSGGLDSTVATSSFKDEYEIHALTFNYGQRSAQREIKAASGALADDSPPAQIVNIGVMNVLQSRIAETYQARFGGQVVDALPEVDGGDETE